MIIIHSHIAICFSFVSKNVEVEYGMMICKQFCASYRERMSIPIHVHMESTLFYSTMWIFIMINNYNSVSFSIQWKNLLIRFYLMYFPLCFDFIVLASSFRIENWKVDTFLKFEEQCGSHSLYWINFLFRFGWARAIISFIRRWQMIHKIPIL